MQVRELLKQGYSIIPIKTGPAKEPAIRWKHYQRNRASIPEINRWYEQFGKTNYATVCGLVSDLGVIDVDDLKQIPKLLEKIPDLFSTTIIKTPRPGLQFYFKLQGKRIKSTNKLFGLASVELRCEGRYVMSPGSVIGGVKYVFERPLTYILPVPKIIIDLYQETYGVITKGIEIPKVKALCVEQILNYDIPEPGRELAYFIAYSKLREAGNTVKYSKYIIKLANRNLSKPLPEREIENFNYKKTYHYGCPKINEELGFIDCSSCSVRGGLHVGSLLMRSIHKLHTLTTSERSVLAVLDSYFRGLEPTAYEVSKYITNMNHKTILEAMKELKRKGIL